MIRYEQAVYGSFPFWDKGYALLAASPGCRPEWLTGFQQACEQYGEPPGGIAVSGALFALRLACGPWVIVGVSSSGTDDHGRPGALAFHGLFVRGRELRHLPGGPFALAPALREAWTAGTTLDTGVLDVVEPSGSGPVPAELAGRIRRALLAGRRVVIASSEPIAALARSVWSEPAELVGRHCSVATLAFSNANRFDLVALPKLAGVELTPADLTLESLDRAWAGRGAGPGGAGRVWLALTTAGAIGALGAAFVLGRRGDRERFPAPSDDVARVEPEAVRREAVPPPVFRERPLRPDQTGQVAESLFDLADRFGVAEGAEPAAEPARLMRQIAERLRYRGRWLSERECAELARSGAAEAKRALAWHEHLRHFAGDRPLPADFGEQSLSRQLELLAWSFGVDPPAEAIEVPFALAESLSLAGSARPTALAERYPALSDYARFLARLPAR